MAIKLITKTTTRLMLCTKLTATPTGTMTSRRLIQELRMVIRIWEATEYFGAFDGLEFSRSSDAPVPPRPGNLDSKPDLRGLACPVDCATSVVSLDADLELASIALGSSFP